MARYDLSIGVSPLTTVHTIPLNCRYADKAPPANSFETKTKSSRGLDLKLTAATLQRRNARGSVSTLGSQESDLSAFGKIEARSDSLKIKKLTIEFYETKGQQKYSRFIMY